ncbi:MAG: hypothetical protein QOD86_383 [Miltoncostaeaceae bacterium]|nr:hypothetical protein [Miltoncostaeaceae bacterium]
MIPRGPRPVLALVLGMLLVSETALSPFYPALFRELFGIEDLDATGTYLWVCRLAGVIALPLWGLAARRWPLWRLVATGLGAAIALNLALAAAPSFALFTAVSALLVACGAAILLAYPALVGLDERDGDRLPGVVAFAALFHAALTVSTALGAGVLALPEPRLGIAAFSLLDAAMLVLVLRVLPRAPAPAPAPAGERRARRGLVLLAGVAAVAVLFELAAAAVRPFYVELAQAEGASLAGGAALFMLASAAALAVLPLARPLRRRLGAALLPTSLAVSAAGLLLQAVAPDLTTMTGARILFGAGLGLGQVALDLRMFAVVGTTGPGFAAVETARAGALLAAPVLAAATASASLALPLVAGAALLAVAAAVSPLLCPSPLTKEPRDLRFSR